MKIAALGIVLVFGMDFYLIEDSLPPTYIQTMHTEQIQQECAQVIDPIEKERCIQEMAARVLEKMKDLESEVKELNKDVRRIENKMTKRRDK